MARLNQLIRAFEPEEIKFLAEVLEREEGHSIEEGYELPECFKHLREVIQSANRYARGLRKEHAA